MLKLNKDIQIGDTGRTLEMLGETVAETLPIGAIAPFGGSTSQVPQNWLPCDGREVSRLEYAKLFSIIGTRFGSGDGSTTFNVPDLQGRVPVGQDVNDNTFDALGEKGGEKEHTLTISEMPSHNHNMAFRGVNATAVPPSAPGSYPFKIHEDVGQNWAINSHWEMENTGGGQAHNNLQPYQVTLYIIKAFDQQLGNLRSESLPVGSEIDFDGTASEIPEGWEQVDDITLINSRNYASGWVSEGAIPSNTRFLYFVLNGEFTESVFIPLSVAKDYSGASPYFVSNKNGLIYQFYIEANNTIQGLFRAEAGTDYSVKIYGIR